MKKVSVLIPAYNESATVLKIVAEATASKFVDEVIVVDDGSTDATAELAKAGGAIVLQVTENQGKGNALAVGMAAASNEVVLFLDADLVGLNQQHISDLVLPVLNNEVKMTVGKFHLGEFWTTLSQHITPFLSGQRAICKASIEGIKNMERLGFGVETALTLFFRENKIPMKTVQLKHLQHVVKERKFGFFRGFYLRLKMYWQILAVVLLRN